MRASFTFTDMQTDTEKSSTEKSSSKSARREGPVAKSIERQTAKVPSDVFLWAAGAAMAGSLVSQVVGFGRGWKTPSRAPLSTFVGQWVPTLLLFGIYNKIVRTQGSDVDEGEGN